MPASARRVVRAVRITAERSGTRSRARHRRGLDRRDLAPGLSDHGEKRSRIRPRDRSSGQFVADEAFSSGLVHACWHTRLPPRRTAHHATRQQSSKLASADRLGALPGAEGVGMGRAVGRERVVGVDADAVPDVRLEGLGRGSVVAGRRGEVAASRVPVGRAGGIRLRHGLPQAGSTPAGTGWGSRRRDRGSSGPRDRDCSCREAPGTPRILPIALVDHRGKHRIAVSSPGVEAEVVDREEFVVGLIEDHHVDLVDQPVTVEVAGADPGTPR